MYLVFAPVAQWTRVVRFERIGRGFESLRGLHKYWMSVNRKQLQEAIDQMVHKGQQRYNTEAERRVYAYGFVCGLLVELAMRDSLVYQALLAKYRKAFDKK